MINIIEDVLLCILLLSLIILIIIATGFGVIVLLDMIKDYKTKWICKEKEGEENVKQI